MQQNVDSPFENRIGWISHTPVHWSIARGKSLFTKLDRTVLPSDATVTCFRDGTVTLRSNRRVTGFTEAFQEVGYQGIRRGDFAIHQMDAFAGAVGVADSDGKCSPVISVCRARDGVDPYYFAHIVREMARVQWIKALAKGIRERSTDFRFDTFASQLYPLPPLDEQRAIARFLDRKSRRIARFIHARQRMIALLTEQKQAIIHQAVTRGLDPDVPLKPSGIDWLGDIPTHWELRRLRQLVRRPLQYGANESAMPFDENLARYIRITDIDAQGQLRKETARSISDDAAQHYLLNDGDVLFARSGATAGKTFRYRSNGQPAAFAGYLIRAQVNGSLNPDFLFRFTQSTGYQRWIQLSFIQSTIQNVSAERYGDLVIPVPPTSEQLRLVDFLDSSLTRTQRVIDRARDQIDLLREYRTRLIADVVTGQLDIRDHPDAAEGAPDDPDDPDVKESLDGILDGDGPVVGIEDDEPVGEAAR